MGIPRLSRAMHKRLVGVMSTLAAEGTVNRLRFVQTARPVEKRPLRIPRTRPARRSGLADLADAQASGVQHLPSDTKSPLDI